MTTPFDVSKFRKTITKSIEGVGIGFNDATEWVSTGNHALNYLVSGDFNKGIPLGKVTLFAGESGCLPGSAKVTIEFDGKQGEITVHELKRLYELMPNDIKISTPDGFVPITAWHNKGLLPCFTIKTSTGHTTTCAGNHLIQTSVEHGEDDHQKGLFWWVPADQLHVGQHVLTKDWLAEVTEITPVGELECFDFTVDHKNHRYWGDGISSHNSGKSYICSGNIIKNAQAKGIFVILIDTENALDKTWLEALGVDTSDDKLLKFNMAMIDDIAKTISEFMKEYKVIPEQERPKVLFVIDSLGMTLVPSDTEQFARGELKGNFGLKPKALGALVRNCVNMFGSYNVGLVATNHTYSSADLYQPDQIISGGQSFIFASSIVVSLQKYKLKEDEEGTKLTGGEVAGIRAKCKVIKTRFNKPFEEIELHIPYSTGLSLYSGLFELFEKQKIIGKEGNRYTYIDLNGQVHKYFRKEFLRNESNILDLIMQEFDQKSRTINETTTETTELENIDD